MIEGRFIGDGLWACSPTQYPFCHECEVVEGLSSCIQCLVMLMNLTLFSFWQFNFGILDSVDQLAVCLYAQPNIDVFNPVIYRGSEYGETALVLMSGTVRDMVLEQDRFRKDDY